MYFLKKAKSSKMLRVFTALVFLFLSFINVNVIVTSSEYDLDSIKIMFTNDILAQELSCVSSYHITDTSGMGALVGYYCYSCQQIMVCSDPSYNRTTDFGEVCGASAYASVSQWCK